MNFKRTGWRNIEHMTFMELVPLDDTREHFLGDECWCVPRLELVPDGIPDKMFVHNSNDRRELNEDMVIH